MSTSLPPWHGLTPEEVARRLQCDPEQGLTEAEAQARLLQHGTNRLAEKPPRSKWLLFADQFLSPLVLVLLGAAALAGAIGDPKDAVVILVVVLLNAALGFWQEHRAVRDLAGLELNAVLRR